jgi:tetratricopeptide (TPR) repeat protein
MRRLPAFAAIVVSTICLASSGVDAQSPWMKPWLDEYAAGNRVAVAQRLTTVGTLKTFEGDLDKVAKAFIAEQKFPDQARRILAAFALEAATSHLSERPAAAKLIEWGCRQVRENMPPAATPGEFEQRWHLAAFASLSGAIDPDALEAHTAHVKLQFPKEPRILYERGVAAEQRTAPFLITPRVSAAEITKRHQEAAAKYREASADPAVRAEALMRLGRVELALDHPDAAIEALRTADAAATEPAVQYLARFFLGQALERQGHREQAADAYRRALAIVPAAQSARLALAAIEFRQGAREQADRTVTQLLAQPGNSDDPWWNYWPGDFRRIDTLMNAMREAIK